MRGNESILLGVKSIRRRQGARNGRVSKSGAGAVDEVRLEGKMGL